MINVIYLNFFFFNDTATTEIYTLSLHDALPISAADAVACCDDGAIGDDAITRCLDTRRRGRAGADRKSTRLNSSHANISYAVFCLKKKNPVHPSLYRSISLPSVLSLSTILSRLS